MSPRVRIIVLTFVGLVLPFSAMAQWTEQTIHLEPGWNAVFFEVEPSPRDCDSVFNGIPVESVWAWNRRFTSVQFIQDPDTLLPEQPEWITYFPPTSGKAHLTDLYILRGGRPYLIKLQDGAAPVDLKVKGQPRIRPVEWLSDSFNLVGFYIDAASPPTFAEFFAGSAAHGDLRIHRIDPSSGDWRIVADPTTTNMQAGEACWVYCKGQSAYQGPVQVHLRNKIDFARTLMEYDLRISNHAASDRTVSIRQQPSGAPPEDPSLPALAGTVPLSYFRFDIDESDPGASKYGWYVLPDPLTVTVPAGEEVSVRLSVRRTDMKAAPVGRESLYQCLLSVSDGEGCRFVLPVCSKGLGAPRVSPPLASAGATAGGVVKMQGPEPHLRTGLWVGHATIQKVSSAVAPDPDPDLRPTSEPLPIQYDATPTTTPAHFTFRLIVHVDNTGKPRLLQQVYQTWEEGAWIPNPDDPTSETFILDPNQVGKIVLLTDDSKLGDYGGVVLRDTKLVGRRLSSVAFPTSGPIPMWGGEFGVAGGPATTCSIVLPYNDLRNPFVHKYHSEHDNLDLRFATRLSEGKESYTVVREIALQFTDDDPENLASAAWGDEELGGIYWEAVTGLHRKQIDVQGIFRLRRICDVGVLNP